MMTYARMMTFCIVFTVPKESSDKEANPGNLS